MKAIEWKVSKCHGGGKSGGICVNFGEFEAYLISKDIANYLSFFILWDLTETYQGHIILLQELQGNEICDITKIVR